MRYLSSILFLLITPFASFAAETGGLLVKSELTYVSGKREVRKAQESILSDSMKSWTSLTDIKDGVLLLGRMVKTSDQLVEMEFIVVDTLATPNRVVATPSIISPMGQPSKISVESNNDRGVPEKIEVSLTASRTKFRKGPKLPWD